MKLYRVTVEYDLLVAAEDEDVAADVAIENAEAALGDMTDQPTITVHDITEPRQIPAEWKGCLPYMARRHRNAPDLTVEEVLRRSLSGQEKP